MNEDEVVDFLKEKPDYEEDLGKIFAYEVKTSPKDDAYTNSDSYDVDTHWEYEDVGVHPSKLHQLVVAGIVNKFVDTNSCSKYHLVSREAVGRALKRVEEFKGKEVVKHEFPDTEEDLPDWLFDNVIGFDDVKWLLKRGMTTDSITNFLLLGPPGSAKTVFLLSIRKLQKAEYLFGPDISSAGFNEMMFTAKPKYVLIDEIDDMDNGAQEVLSSYTENGIVKETKYGKDREMQINAKTFAAGNKESNILNHIKDRFTPLRFERYTEEEFVEVCEEVLPSEEGCESEEAKTIAEYLYDMKNSTDVRQAIQVARLSRGDPKKVIDTLDKYSNDSSLISNRF